MIHGNVELIDIIDIHTSAVIMLKFDIPARRRSSHQSGSDSIKSARNIAHYVSLRATGTQV